MTRAAALALLAALLTAAEAGACAVSGSVRVENRTTLRVREAFVSAPDQGANQLPPGGLAPGQAATITLPSCLGTYRISVVYGDGSRSEHPGLDGTRVIGIVLSEATVRSR